MKKPAETSVPIHDLIRHRWSPMAFSDKPIEEEKLLALFEAARWAPSSYNEQPWAFLVATKENREEFERMLGCLVEGNQAWAKHAPVLMVSLAKLHFARNNKPNRHAFHDVGLAAANLVLQAEALGLQAHQMAGIEVDKIRIEYEVPEGWEPVAGIAVGYPTEDFSHLPEKLQQRQTKARSRKPLAEFVFSARFGQQFL